MLSTQLYCFVRRRKGNSLEATATDKEDAEVERLGTWRRMGSWVTVSSVRQYGPESLSNTRCPAGMSSGCPVVEHNGLSSKRIA